MSTLQSPVLHVDEAASHGPELNLDLSTLQRPVLLCRMCLNYRGLISSGLVYATEACAAPGPGRVYTAEDYAAPGRVYNTGVAPVLVFTIEVCAASRLVYTKGA
jgi:hypothetical protein